MVMPVVERSNTCSCMPGPIRDFRDLVCWQRAIELSLVCEDVADALPKKSWKAAQQLRDAADSIHLNIAEWNGRPTLPDYLRHLGIADASLNEVQSNLFKISRRYPGITGTPAALALAAEVARPLNGMIRALRKKRRVE